jgi:hypothetical protein
VPSPNFNSNLKHYPCDKKKIPLDILGWRMCHEEYSKNDGCKIDNEEAENGLSHF